MNKWDLDSHKTSKGYQNHILCSWRIIFLPFLLGQKILQQLLVWVRTEFEPLTGLRTTKCMMHYSYVLLNVAKQKYLRRGVSDSLSVVFFKCLKKLLQKGARSCGIIMCCPTLPIYDIDIVVENIPISTCWSLNHYAAFCPKQQRNCSCLTSKLRICWAGLKLLRSPKGLCKLGWVAGGEYCGHTSGQRCLTNSCLNSILTCTET